MPDNGMILTAIELRAIRERVSTLGMFDRPWTDAERDRANLLAALEHLLSQIVFVGCNYLWWSQTKSVTRTHETMDAAIDALLMSEPIDEKEKRRREIDAAFVRAGHKPENRNCDHKHWRGVPIDGRYCSCGTCMVDYGD